MSKAAELAKWGEVSTNGQVSGRRNIVINGAMNVAQRSASVTGLGAAAGYFTVDRWKVSPSGTAGRLTMTQTADGPTGFANCIKLDCTTADTSIAAGEYLVLHQNFEGQDVQAIGKGVAGAKEITVSFYVKANAAFTFGVELEDLDNTRQITKLFNTTTGWVRHEFTFPADVDDGSSPFGDDNAGSLAVNFFLHAGATFTGGTLNTTAWANSTNANRAAGIDSFYSSTDNNFFITGVQMEVGSVATPFEHASSFGEQLVLCQRYYQVYGGTSYTTIASGVQPNTTNAKFHLSYMQEMRTAPSIAVSDVTELIVTERTTFDTVLSGLSGNVAGKTSAYLSAQFGASGVGGRGILLAVKNGTTTTLSLDSEL
jgi:hypothetical protein